MSNIKQLCTGELTGFLHCEDNTLLRSSNNTLFSIRLSKRFKYWVDNLENKSQLETERTYAVLPKTLRHYPYLIFEILGVESTGVSNNDRACVIGIFEREYESNSYIRVHKSTIRSGDTEPTNSSFLFRVKGVLYDSNGYPAKEGNLWSLNLQLNNEDEYEIQNSTLLAN